MFSKDGLYIILKLMNLGICENFWNFFKQKFQLLAKKLFLAWKMCQKQRKISIQFFFIIEKML